ncbi:uncharacterized protein [Primulina huaijiensis]|uniref:uncharacterized protein n=1 Tax=Primulina huaijiensis TaxID=1492673 RepID=UPI003CC77621
MDVIPNLNRVSAEDFMKQRRVIADEEAVTNMINDLPLEDAVSGELEAVGELEEHELEVDRGMLLEDAAGGMEPVVVFYFVKQRKVIVDEEAVANMRNDLPLENAVSDELEAVRELEEHELEVGRGMLLEDAVGEMEPVVVLDGIYDLP